MTKATQYKVYLPTLDKDGKDLSEDQLFLVKKEQETIDKGQELSDLQRSQQVERGLILDSRKLLIGILGLPEDAQKGADYAEMRAIAPLLDKLEDEASYILLDDDKFNLLERRVKGHKFPAASKQIRLFVEGIIESEKVPVVESPEGELTDFDEQKIQVDI